MLATWPTSCPAQQKQHLLALSVGAQYHPTQNKNQQVALHKRLLRCINTGQKFL
jgi:hypothetical protein